MKLTKSAQLKTNLELLQKRTSALNTEMEQEEEKSHNAAFDTDDPELNRHSVRTKVYRSMAELTTISFC